MSEHEPEEKLTSKQVRAIVALLRGDTFTDAAKYAGTSRSQLWRWRKHDEHFQERLQEERSQLVDTVTQRLSRAALDAVDALLEVVNDEDATPGARAQAADAILKRVAGSKSDVVIQDQREDFDKAKGEKFDEMMAQWEDERGPLDRELFGAPESEDDESETRDADEDDEPEFAPIPESDPLAERLGRHDERTRWA